MFFPQDKSDFPSDSLQEPFLASSDPAVTEIEEVPAQEEQESPDSVRNPREELPEHRELPRTVVPPITPTPEQLSAYKPHFSKGNALGYVAAGIHPAQPPAEIPEPELGIFSQDYTSPVPSLWEQQGGAPRLCLLGKINLVLNSSQEFPEQAGLGSFLEQPREQRAPSDVPEQMLVPEELLSCLRATNREPGHGNPCFPPSMGGFF